MLQKTSKKIIAYLKKNKEANAQELSDYLEISDRAVRKQLKTLLEKEVISKIGKPPRVFYLLKEKKEKSNIEIEKAVEKIIDERFLLVTPTGQEKNGFDGFKEWCEKQKLPLEKTANEYLKTLEKYDKYIENDLIDGTSKIKNTFKSDSFIDLLYYLDFYSIERFGKTKLGQLLLYAKQSQSKSYIRKLIHEIKPKTELLIKKEKIDCIGFIPPSVKREVQLMKELEKNIGQEIKRLSIVKVKSEIIVPQKTLNKLNDRIENARSTIIVNDKGKYKNILLIDDAVGSGATINETARKIKEKKLCKGKVIGLAITGSFKGFDVISEV